MSREPEPGARDARAMGNAAARLCLRRPQPQEGTR